MAVVGGGFVHSFKSIFLFSFSSHYLMSIEKFVRQSAFCFCEMFLINYTIMIHEAGVQMLYSELPP